MRYLYTLAFYLALPFILLRTAWRSRKRKDHLKRIGERLGFYRGNRIANSIWLHAVSYGEAVAAEPLLQKLKTAYPTTPIVMTTMTLTGAIRVNSICQGDEQIRHLYFPYDVPFAIKRFLNYASPQIGIIMETELWPNVLHLIGKRNIPLLLANARLSPQSLSGYKRISRFISPLLNNIARIAVQSPQDAERFIALGAPKNKVCVLGNLKFDFVPQALQIDQGRELKKTLSFDHVIIAASTHANEEEQILEVYSDLQREHPSLLLIIVPRHPERFEEVANLCIKKGHRLAKRSLNEIPSTETTVFLGDTMGEMSFFYSLADIAFVGGSLVPVGGHNLLEPASLKLPIVSGPHLFNFIMISQLLQEREALHIAHDRNELFAICNHLLQDKSYSQHVGQEGFQVLEKNQGATDRHMAVISTLYDVEVLRSRF